MPGVLPLSPFPIFADPNNQVVQANATITSNGSQIYLGIGSKELNLVINIKAAPTGSTPQLTFSLQEVDPGDQTTLIGAATSGAALNSATTQIVSMPLSQTGAVKVSWVISGAGASFTQVYVTLVSKITSAQVEVTDGTNVLGTSGHPVRTDPTGSTTQPVSGSVTANQGSAAALAGAWPVEMTDGTNVLGVSAHPVRTDPTGSTTQPVSGTVAATQSGAWTVAATQSGAWTADVTDRAARLLGVVYGSQGVQIKQTATNNNLQVEVAVGGTLVDPRSIRALTSSDVVTSAQGTGAAAGAPWSVELSDGAAFYTGAKTGQFPSALVGGRLDENVGSWLGSTAPTVGSKTSANSVPVVIASDQGAVAVTAAQATAANLNATVVQGAGSGAAGTYWYVRATDGTNTMPTGDAVARSIFHQLTDGTHGPVAVKAASTAAVAADLALVVTFSPNTGLPTGANVIGAVTQGAGSGAAGTYWYARVTDGTNTLPTMDVVARAAFIKWTDGTNTAAVKAASTAAVAGDPSGVVALSPNTPLPAGTNSIGTVNQGTAASVANSWNTEITDGTHGPAAVKAASTAVAAADASLAVGLSPNSPLPAGTNNIGGVELIDSAGTNKAKINTAGQVFVTTDNPSQLEVSIRYDQTVNLGAGQSGAGIWNKGIYYTVPATYKFVIGLFSSFAGDNKSALRATKLLALGSYNIGTTTYTAGSTYTTPQFGDVLEVEVTTVIGATNNFTLTITYTNQAGTAGQSATVAIPKSTAVGTKFVATLAAGDYGVQAVTAVSTSASNTGVMSINGCITLDNEYIGVALVAQNVFPSYGTMVLRASDILAVDYGSPGGAGNVERSMRVTGVLGAA